MERVRAPNGGVGPISVPAAINRGDRHARHSAFLRSFYDSSIWEARAIEGDEAVKRLIREGVEYTSAVCVLVGSGTWLRRWVRYEIARAVIDGRGLLAVHLNNITHHKTLGVHALGPNPLYYMGVGKFQSTLLSTPSYYLYEKVAVGFGWEWRPRHARPVWIPPEPPTRLIMNTRTPAAGELVPALSYSTLVSQPTL
jgi:hypothetical protein